MMRKKFDGEKDKQGEKEEMRTEKKDEDEENKMMRIRRRDFSSTRLVMHFACQSIEETFMDNSN